jgi:uncharacterized sulfatase
VLSGRNIWEVGEAGVLYGTIPAQLSLFPHRLEDAGYLTGFTGKSWGPGDWRAAGMTRHPAGREFNSRVTAYPRAGIDTRDYSANFGEFLDARKPGQPFCFWFGPTEPHRVYEKGAGRRAGKNPDRVRVPKYWPDTEEVRSDILDYYEEIEYFDWQLGRALSMLERAGEWENTLIIVTSDNGMPFPRAKVNLYDGGTRMPLAIAWPGVIGGRQQSRDFVSHADLAPTILEAAGLGGSERSLLGRMKGDWRGAQRDHAITALERHTMCRPDGATYPARAIRTAQHLYIRNYAPERWPTGGEFLSSNKTTHGDVDSCPTKTHMLSREIAGRYPRQYDLCFGRRPAEELYDMARDPDQVDNIAGEAASEAVKKELAGRLEAYLRQTGDPRLEGQDPWQSYPYRQTTGFGASFNSALPAEVRERFRVGDAHKPE